MRECNRFLEEPNTRSAQRSGCPINLTLEVFGDKWSLLMVRDMILGSRRHFREQLTRSTTDYNSFRPPVRLMPTTVTTKVEQLLQSKSTTLRLPS